MISERAEYDPKQHDARPTRIIVTQSTTCRIRRKS